MPRVLRTPAARADLLEIFVYIAEDSFKAADRLLSLIEEACQTVAGHPEAGRRREELGSNLRSFPSGRYVIFYRPIPDGIEVIRVLHGARDTEGQLPEP